MKNFRTRGKSIVRCKKPLPEVELPAKFEEIADKAFFGDNVIKKVIIPGSIRVINYGAFESAAALETVSFPAAGMVNLKNRGFMGCRKLSHIENMSIIISYGDKAFKDCENLMDCDINPYLGDLGKSCFEGCKKISSVKLPIDHEDIPQNAFFGCENLSNIEFGNSIKNIGKKAFGSCISLNNMCFTDTLETVGESAFEDCYSIPKIKFGSNIKKIGKNAFKNCLYLNSVEFSPVTSSKKVKIESGAFSGCVELRTITIPNGKWSISPSAFKKCKLHSVDPLTIICYSEETADSLAKCLVPLVKKEEVNIILKDMPVAAPTGEACSAN